MSKIDTPLSDGAVREALGADTRILKYSELKKYGSMAELLPKPNTFFICLLEEDVNRGHWVAMMRLKKNYFYFNSYGVKYDADLSVIPRCIRKILGQDPAREFTRLLGGRKCEWNKTKLQGETSQVCGRYCVLAIVFCCFLGHSPAELVEFLTEKAENESTTPDAVVTSIISI
jgi:hypothetical protein